MPNSEIRDSSRRDAVFPRSPMMRRIEQGQRISTGKRIAGIIIGIAAGAIAIATIGPEVFKLFGKEGVAAVGASDVPSGPCALDDPYYEENGFPFSPGSADGCVLLCQDEQLASPLCCPHVADDPSKCPPLDPDSTLPGGVH